MSKAKISFLATNRIHLMIGYFEKSGKEALIIEQIRQMLDLLSGIDINPALHELQNFLFILLKKGDNSYKHCYDSLCKLAEQVNLDVDAIVKKEEAVV